MTLLEFFRNRMVALNPKIRSGATREAYEIEIRVLQKYFDTEYPCRPTEQRPLLLSDLSSDLVGGAAAWQVARGRSPATANRLIRQITSIWSRATQDDAVNAITPPLKKVQKHKEPKRIPEAWSADDFTRLVAAAAQRPGYVGGVLAAQWWPCLLLTAYWTGVRISAIMALPTHNVDLTKGTLLFAAETQKHFSDQEFDLPPDVVALLRKLNPGARGLETFFGDWPFDRNARQWAVLSRHFSAIAKAAGLQTGRRYKFHMIRRTFATQVAAKEGLATAQSMLGHSSSATTQRYIDPRFMRRPRATSILTPVPLPSSEGFRIVG